MRTSQPIPAIEEITLTWTTTTVEEHQHTFTYGTLREAVDAIRARHGQSAHPDISEDLHLLEDGWLGEFEESGELSEFTREITDASDLARPVLPVFTVTVEGPERHDGEAPYTYALPATDLDDARALTLAWHTVSHELGAPGPDGENGAADVRVVEGPWDTFSGAPVWPADLPSRAWNDLRTDTEFAAFAEDRAATHD